jgi:tetratricopeptide (TPR) repeat protein
MRNFITKSLKSLFILSFIILFSGKLYSQTQVYNVFTPRGSLVPNTYTMPELSSSQLASLNNQVISGFPSATLLEYATQLYNCHAYAWHISEGGGKVWINTGAQFIYWEDGSYDEVSEACATKVRYSGDHSAVTTNTPNVYISKWGAGPRMRHNKNDVPQGYSTPYKFYARAIEVNSGPELISALSAAQSCCRKVHILGSVTFTVSTLVTVPSCVTLVMHSGSNVTFAGGMVVNGSLTTNGATLNFASGTGLVINGTINSQNTLFTGSYNWSGIVINSSTIFISNTIRYAVTGLTLTASTYLQSNNIHDCGMGMHVSNTHISLPTGNKIQNNNGTGVLFSGYSQGLFFPNNKIINNDLNIFIESNAHPDFGVYTGLNDQGRNSIYGGYPYDIRSQYTGTISAQCNWWGGYPIYPPYNPYLDVTSPYGSINVDYALNYNPNPLIGIIEETHNTKGRSLQKSSIEAIESIEGIKEFDEARALLQDTLKRKEGENLLLNILSKHSDKQSGRLAFVALYYYYNTIEDEDSKKMILLESTHKDESLSSLAMYFKARDYKESGDYKSAIEELEKAVNKRHSSDIMPYVYYDLGTLYCYNLDDKEKGEKYYRELAEKYPGEAITKTVLSIRKLPPKEKEPPTETTDETVITETKLFANYPNPFNPSTIIKYQLSEASLVSLKVYDVMGKEVTTLVNSFQNKGSYDITFNAQGLSSGIYFYKLNVNGKQLINKMLLMK